MGVQLQRGVGLALCILSIILLIWGFRPTSHLEKHLVVSPEGLIVTPQEAFEGPAVSIDSDQSEINLSAGQINLSVPDMIRTGDVGEIRLIIEPTPHGDLVVDPGTIAEREPASAPYGQTSSLTAHLDLPGIRFSPTGEIKLALPTEKPAIFLWSLRPQDAGNYQGSLWLHFLSGNGNNGESNRKVLLNQLVDVSVRSLFGMTGQQARLLGGIGILIGAYILLQSMFQAAHEKANTID